MGSKSTLRLMRTLGPSLGSLAQSTWSLLLMALVTGPFLGRIASVSLNVWILFLNLFAFPQCLNIVRESLAYLWCTFYSWWIIKSMWGLVHSNYGCCQYGLHVPAEEKWDWCNHWLVRHVFLSKNDLESILSKSILLILI